MILKRFSPKSDKNHHFERILYDIKVFKVVTEVKRKVKTLSTLVKVETTYKGTDALCCEWKKPALLQTKGKRNGRS